MRSKTVPKAFGGVESIVFANGTNADLVEALQPIQDYSASEENGNISDMYDVEEEDESDADDGNRSDVDDGNRSDIENRVIIPPTQGNTQGSSQATSTPIQPNRFFNITFEQSPIQHFNNNRHNFDDDVRLSTYSIRSGGVQRSLPNSQLSEDRSRIQHGRVDKTKKLTKQQKKVEREIRNQQKSTNLLLKATPFTRIVKQMIFEIGGQDYRVQSEAINALMEASQHFLINLFEASNLATGFANRKTLQVKDIHLVTRILACMGHEL